MNFFNASNIFFFQIWSYQKSVKVNFDQFPSENSLIIFCHFNFKIFCQKEIFLPKIEFLDNNWRFGTVCTQKLSKRFYTQNWLTHTRWLLKYFHPSDIILKIKGQGRPLKYSRLRFLIKNDDTRSSHLRWMSNFGLSNLGVLLKLSSISLPKAKAWKSSKNVSKSTFEFSRQNNEFREIWFFYEY